jgi:hypothetical protein
VALRPAASQDRCQGGMQDLEELRLEKPQGPLGASRGVIGPSRQFEHADKPSVAPSRWSYPKSIFVLRRGATLLAIF